MSIYLEDLTAGRTFRSVGRTITEADIVNFAGVSGDFNPLHTDEVWVQEHTEFSGRIAHGTLVLSAANSLRTPGVSELEILAFLEIGRRMLAPTYPGDTIYSVYTVESARASGSRPGTGVVKFRVDIENQRGEIVQSGHDVYLVTAAPQAVPKEPSS